MGQWGDGAREEGLGVPRTRGRRRGARNSGDSRPEETTAVRPLRFEAVGRWGRRRRGVGVLRTRGRRGSSGGRPLPCSGLSVARSRQLLHAGSPRAAIWHSDPLLLPHCLRAKRPHWPRPSWPQLSSPPPLLPQKKKGRVAAALDSIGEVGSISGWVAARRGVLRAVCGSLPAPLGAF